VLCCSIQDIYDQPLSDTSHIKKDYLDKIFKMEKDLQEQELQGKHVSIIADATPRMGDVFSLITRCVSVLNHKATVQQHLVDVAFVNYLLSASSQCGAVQKALMSVRLACGDVTSASMDGCWTNEVIAKHIEEDQDAVWMLKHCFAHCGKNASVEAGFPTLDHFLSLLQKIFCQSESARVLFQSKTGVSWKSFSDNRWWSQFEVLHTIYSNFSCMTAIVVSIFNKHVSPANSAKMRKMLQDPVSFLYVKIELGSYVEGLMKVVQFTYGAERDGQLVFEFGYKIDELISSYPQQGLCNLSSANVLIKEAVEWASKEGYKLPIPTIIGQSRKEVASSMHVFRPQRPRYKLTKMRWAATSNIVRCLQLQRRKL
jgi:hypothetical protein